MADPVTVPDAPETDPNTPAPAESEVEKAAFLERLGKESSKRKEAEKQAATLAKQITDLQARIDERESAGLPELDQMKRRLEAAERKATEAEERATQFEQQATNTRRERWITAAASSQNFIDPDDASRFVDLADIESAEDAERAVKRIAKAKKHLVKADEPVIPGRVLQNGQPATATNGKAGSNIDLSAEAQALSDALKQFASQD